MDSQEIIKELQMMATEKYKANVVKMGIPEENSDIRSDGGFDGGRPFMGFM